MKGIIKIIMCVSILYQFVDASSFEDSVDRAKKIDVEIPQPVKVESKEYSQKDLDYFFSYFDNLLKEKELEGKGYYSVTKQVKEVTYSIDLKQILNKYLKSPITFKTSRGTIIYVSASRSSNCPDLTNNCNLEDKIFIVLTTSLGETFFIRAKDIVNFSFFMKGSKTVIIDGEEYTLKIYANVSEPSKSVLEVKGPAGIVIKSDLAKLAEALASKIPEIKLSRTYKLAYGNEIIQTGNGNAKFTGNKILLLFPTPVEDVSTYYVIKASDIKSEGTVFPTMEANYIFSLKDEILEITMK